MNPDQFKENAPGRLIQLAHEGSNYYGFMPNPLPPTLQFDLPLIRLLSEAGHALGELSGLGRALPNPHLLINPFIRREAVLSSRIEGTQSDLTDLYAFEAGQLSLPGLKPIPPESDVREVSNYVVALEYGLDRVANLPASLRLMRELHERLLRGVRGEKARPGEFRETQNCISGRHGPGIQNATFVPAPPPEMHSALDAFEKYLHADDPYPPLVRLALIHYQFEAIHPFIDGNGRIGRLLLSLLLVNWGLLQSPLLYLSAYFEKHRDEYYDLLLAVSTNGAWMDWIAFFLAGVAEQACDAIDRAKRLQDLQAKWREQLTRTRAPALALRLADSLFESPVLTIPQAQERLGVRQYHTAQQRVQQLEKPGILKQIGDSARGKTFIATEILDIVTESKP